MAQHVIPTAQLVPKYKPIGRCNNYAVLQSIPCSPECKIVGLILLDHCLSHALTATADVPAVYLQQFWRTVSKVPDTEDTIKFMLDTQQFTYTVDMFRDTLQLLVKTPENLFVAPANIQTIEAFMNRVGYQGVVDKVSAFYTKNLAQPWQTMFKVFNRCLTTRTSGHDQTKINILQLFHVVLNQTHVDYAALLWWDFMNNVFQKKEAIQYPRFIKLIVADLMKKLPNIPKRLEEDYHSIKDDVPLVSVYTTGNVLVRGMLIPYALLTAKIKETDDFKEYETVFMMVDVLMNKPQSVVSTQGTNRNTPRAPRTPTVSASPRESKKRKQTAEESKSYASAFADTVLNDNDDETGSKLEPRSHKEHPEHVSDDDEIKKKDEEVEKKKEVVEIVKETNVDDTSAKKNKEVVTEKEVVAISDKTISEEFTDTVTPTTATSSKTPSTTTRQKKSFTLKTRHLPESIDGMCRRRGLIRSHIKTKFITREIFVEKIKEVIQHCDNIVLELTVTTTNEMLKKEMPRLVKLAVNKDREVSPVDISGMVSKEFAAHRPKLI
ncbi:hypothetical protein Tco_1517235 [Tanacetum coccineum]